MWQHPLIDSWLQLKCTNLLSLSCDHNKPDMLGGTYEHGFDYETECVDHQFSHK